MVEINIPEVTAEVADAFARYERAFVAGDAAALDALFWANPLALRYGVRENLYGYEAIAAFRATQPAMDMTRRLMNTVITTYGRHVATVNTEFHRVGAPMPGRQSQVWLKTDQGWRVAVAHVSLLPARMPAPAASPPRA